MENQAEARTTTLAILPPELVQMILELAWENDWMKRMMFTKYPLICASWRPIAQRILFTHIILRDADQAIKFLQAVSLNPALGQYTKILFFWPEVYINRRIGLTLVREITSMCPWVYYLVIRIPVDVEGHEVLNAIHPHTYASLKALNIYFTGSNRSTSLTLNDVFHFLNRFTNLSHLTLEGLPPLKESSVLPRATGSISPNLYELNIDPPTQQQLHLFRQELDWFLIATNPETLKIVELKFAPQNHFDLFCRIFLRERGSGLHSLRLWVNEDTILNSNVQLSVVCPGLREIVLPDCPLVKQVMEILPVDKLEHLAFAHIDGGEEEMRRVKEWIITLPRLRYVTIYRRGRTSERDIRSFWEEQALEGIT
ncbi:hypothetical protein FRC02_009599, partial [Tulasnella sp. 418]